MKNSSWSVYGIEASKRMFQTALGLWVLQGWPLPMFLVVQQRAVVVDVLEHDLATPFRNTCLRLLVRLQVLRPTGCSWR